MGRYSLLGSKIIFLYKQIDNKHVLTFIIMITKNNKQSLTLYIYYNKQIKIIY